MKLMVGHSVRDTHRVISAFVYCHVELTEWLPSKSHRFVFHWLEYVLHPSSHQWCA
jgi:hypothetical protein